MIFAWFSATNGSSEPAGSSIGTRVGSVAGSHVAALPQLLADAGLLCGAESLLFALLLLTLGASMAKVVGQGSASCEWRRLKL